MAWRLPISTAIKRVVSHKRHNQHIIYNTVDFAAGGLWCISNAHAWLRTSNANDFLLATLRNLENETGQFVLHLAKFPTPACLAP